MASLFPFAAKMLRETQDETLRHNTLVLLREESLANDVVVMTFPELDGEDVVDEKDEADYMYEDTETFYGAEYRVHVVYADGKDYYTAKTAKAVPASLAAGEFHGFAAEEAVDAVAGTVEFLQPLVIFGRNTEEVVLHRVFRVDAHHANGT